MSARAGRRGRFTRSGLYGFASPALALLLLSGEQLYRLLEGKCVRIGSSRQRGKDPCMADIGTIPTAAQRHGAAVRMLAELAHHLRASTPFCWRVGEQDHGAVQADGQHVVIGSERLEGRPMLDVRAKTADAGDDRLAGLRMSSKRSRQCKQPQCGLEVYVGQL